MAAAPVNVTEDLLALKDSDKLQAFSARLVPNIAPETVIGIRVPGLRTYAKQLVKADGGAHARAFMQSVPHNYLEENILHGLCIGLMARDAQEGYRLLDEFLPYVDNWMVCDVMRVRAFREAPESTFAQIVKWLDSDHDYTVRFGVITLMSGFLDERFALDHLDLVASVVSDEYYVNMARAWYFATALTKQWDATSLFLESDPPALDAWTHNKAIQKARESSRIPKERKDYLRTLKRPAK